MAHPRQQRRTRRKEGLNGAKAPKSMQNSHAKMRRCVCIFLRHVCTGEVVVRVREEASRSVEYGLPSRHLLFMLF